MEWIKIFSGDQEARQRIIADKPQLLILYGKRICLTLHDDKFFAVQDACSHNGESLSKGVVNHHGELVCPLHHYQFNMLSGRECSSRARDLITYPIKIDESGFFIGI